MPEAVELLYIRNGLNYVIEQFSIYVFKCCKGATTPKLLENRKKPKKKIWFNCLCDVNVSENLDSSS